MEIALVAVKVIGVLVGGAAGLLEIFKKNGEGHSSRPAVLLLVFGLSAAVTAELIDATVKRREGDEAIKRNNELLVQVQRTIHLLFPLSINVSYRAPLMDSRTALLRRTLEAQLRQVKLRDKEDDIDVFSIKLDGPNTYLLPQRDPFGYGLVTADLNSWVRLYSREKTQAANFKEDDMAFCVCPLSHYPFKGKISMTDWSKLVLAYRNIIFDPGNDAGLTSAMEMPR